MNSSDQINEVSAALAKAQGVFKHILRDKTVKVRTRTGGEYTFRYAPLESIIDATRKALSDNGLALIQGEVEGKVSTRLVHSSGQFLENLTKIFIQPKKDERGNESAPSAQEYGSALTYARRYGITLLLGVSADDDDDGNAADGNEATEVVRKPQVEPEKVAVKSAHVSKKAVVRADGIPPDLEDGAIVPKAELEWLKKLLVACDRTEAAFLAWVGAADMEKLVYGPKYRAAKTTLIAASLKQGPKTDKGKPEKDEGATNG